MLVETFVEFPPSVAGVSAPSSFVGIHVDEPATTVVEFPSLPSSSSAAAAARFDETHADNVSVVSSMTEYDIVINSFPLSCALEDVFNSAELKIIFVRTCNLEFAILTATM